MHQITTRYALCSSTNLQMISGRFMRTHHISLRNRTGGAKLGSYKQPGRWFMERRWWSRIWHVIWRYIGLFSIRMSKSTNITDVLSLVRKFLASFNTRLATLAAEVLSPEFLSFPCTLWNVKASNDKDYCSCRTMTGKNSRKIFYLNNKRCRLFSADDIPEPITAYSI